MAKPLHRKPSTDPPPQPNAGIFLALLTNPPPFLYPLPTFRGRLTVGRLVLAQVIEVQILAPEP